MILFKLGCLVTALLLTCDIAWARAGSCLSAFGASGETRSIGTPDLLTAPQRAAFLARSAKGDLVTNEGQKALDAAEALSRKLGASVLGKGLETCYKTFEPAAASTVHKLLIAAQGASTPAQAMTSLVGEYQRIFKINEPRAKRRICVLASRGPTATPRCEIFSRVIGDECR